MTATPEPFVRAGLGVWFDENEHSREQALPVLQTIGEAYFLIEIDERLRPQVLRDVIDCHQVGDGDLPIDLLLFGAAGGHFAGPLHFGDLWPQSSADFPSDVFVDNDYKAAFTSENGGVSMSVRYAPRPLSVEPEIQLWFPPGEYDKARTGIRETSRQLSDDLIALAQERAPEKVRSLRDVFKHWPA